MPLVPNLVPNSNLVGEPKARLGIFAQDDASLKCVAGINSCAVFIEVLNAWIASLMALRNRIEAF